MARPYALLAAAWAAVIFFTSTTTSPPPALALFPHEDKVVHLLGYALLAVLIYKAFMHSSDLAMARRAAGWTLPLAIGYGALVELYQWYLPWRSCDIGDFLANCVGVVAALLLIGKFHE